MKYLILIQSNPASRALWETMTDEQRWAFGRAHADLNDRLLESGDLVASEGLADPELAKRVSVRDGVTQTSDGPFAEVKEYLAGFYLVECETIERGRRHRRVGTRRADRIGRGATGIRPEHVRRVTPCRESSRCCAS